MRDPATAPAWLSTALEDLVSGPLQRGTVLSSSRFASYLLLPSSPDLTVVALVAPGAVRLPVAACVAWLPALTVGAPATVGGGVIAADGHSWRPARWWDPRPRIDPMALRAHGWHLADVVASEPDAAFGIDLEPARNAVAALAAGDATAACGLLGSGPGLTPSGDDVAAGALAALALMDLLPPAAAAAVTSAARSRTTALSASLLAAAARGQMVPEAARLLGALARGDGPDEVAALARRLFAVGATSGHDLALGLAAALSSVSSVPALEAS